MKRLTEYVNDTPAIILHKLDFHFQANGAIGGDVARKLAAYEDTGLDPEDVNVLRVIHGLPAAEIVRICNLYKAEKEGRLVVLPVATVFAVEWDVGPTCDLICPVTIDGRGQCHICDHGRPVVIERACIQADIPYIGKTVFFTHEEAEVVRVSEMNAENGGGAENECDKRSGDVAD